MKTLNGLTCLLPSRLKLPRLHMSPSIEHKVMPVVSGLRVTLTYNLYFDKLDSVVAPIFTLQGEDHTIKDVLQQLLNDTTFLPNGFTLYHYIAHVENLGSKLT